MIFPSAGVDEEFSRPAVQAQALKEQTVGVGRSFFRLGL